MDVAADRDLESAPQAAPDDPTLDAIFRDGGTPRSDRTVRIVETISCM